jgi:hypothetical protein
MSHNAVVFAVPTHLRAREPFAFGRTVGEAAKLAVAGFVAAQILGSSEFPTVLRVGAAAAVAVTGAAWALVKIQRRSLDGWLGLAFRYGAMPRRRVWRPGSADLRSRDDRGAEFSARGWYELGHVRVRWAPSPAPGRVLDCSCNAVPEEAAGSR